MCAFSAWILERDRVSISDFRQRNARLLLIRRLCKSVRMGLPRILHTAADQINRNDREHDSTRKNVP